MFGIGLDIGKLSVGHAPSGTNPGGPEDGFLQENGNYGVLLEDGDYYMFQSASSPIVYVGTLLFPGGVLQGDTITDALLTPDGVVQAGSYGI